MNWLIVDEEFKKVNSSFHMGAVQVPPITTTMQSQPLTGPANMTVRRNGWLYVYVSNESAQDVYFDDIIVNHKRGPVVEANNYYAFGLEIPGLNSKALGFGGNANNRTKYNGKEAQQKEFADGTGLEWLDYGARMYDNRIARWMVTDPLADKSRRWSVYNYAYNNPLRFIDPDGKFSTDVIKNDDGTLKVVAARANGDRNVYVRSSENGPRTGEVVAKTISDRSFLNDEGKVVKATINLSNNSGANFLKNDIMGNKKLSLFDYMKNATGGGRFDFKTNGIDKVPQNQQEQYMYRAMPVDGVPGLGGDRSGVPTIATARDIGNIGAGYMAGVSGLGWGFARIGLDALESYQKRAPSTEGQTTQLAQKVGWRIGTKSYDEQHSSLPMGFPPLEP